MLPNGFSGGPGHRQKGDGGSRKALGFRGRPGGKRRRLVRGERDDANLRAATATIAALNFVRAENPVVPPLPSFDAVVSHVSIMLHPRSESCIRIICQPECLVPFYPVAVLVVLIDGVRG